MKKLFLLCSAALCLMSAPVMTSCSSDKAEDVITNAIAKVLNVEGATYNTGAMPTGSSNTNIDINYNTSALAGGANIISIKSPVQLAKVFVGVEGIPGYLEFIPQLKETRAQSTAQIYEYVVEVMYATELAQNISLNVSVQTADQQVVSLLNKEAVEYVESKKGDLAINLVFDQDKDVDLWLVMPTTGDDEEYSQGNRIYYGNREVRATCSDEDYQKFEELYTQKEEELRKKYLSSDEPTDEDYMAFEEEMWKWYEENSPSALLGGLDHDSNPSCSIDHLQNENIVIKAEALVPGTYTIYVNMYSNCFQNPAVDTKYTVVARMGDRNIDVTEGKNPFSGSFAYDAFSNDYDAYDRATKAMTFTLTQQQIDSMKGNRAKARQNWHIFRAPMTESAFMKILNSGRPMREFNWTPFVK